MKQKIDALGRVGIPKKIREEMALRPGDRLFIEYDPDQDQIALKKAHPACAACGDCAELLSLHGDFHLCKTCLQKLKVQEAE